jgi:uridine kinase
VVFLKARQPVMESTFKIIKSNYERGKKQNTPYIIGINGIDCAGKTTLAKDLSGELKQSGINNKIFHIDDFNNKKVEKETYRAFASGNWNENDFDRYYESIIDFQKAREAFEKAAAKSEIVIVEGIFIFRPKLKITFNYRIYLEVDASVALTRFEERRRLKGDDRPVEIFKDIWVKAHNKYVSEINPQKICDLILQGP